MPSILRPLPATVCEDQVEHDEFIQGNRLLNLKALSDALGHFNLEHAVERQTCIAHPVWPTDKEVQWGLGIEVNIQCKKCRYMSKQAYKLYEEIENDRPGRKKAKVNVQVVTSTYKSSIGYDDLSIVFAALDCTFLNRSSYYDIINSMAPKLRELAKESIDDNIR